MRWTPPPHLKKTREVAEKNAKTTEFGPPENAKIAKQFKTTRDVDPPHLKKKCGRWPKKPANTPELKDEIA